LNKTTAHAASGTVNSNINSHGLYPYGGKSENKKAGWQK
jgi:hypothetical protein